MTHVLVAGAGIGGLAAALALARSGADVSVLERASSLEPIGAGVQLSPNATRILRDLGVLAALEPSATRPSGVRVRAGRSARELSFLPLAEAASRWGAPYLVVHRADLQAALLEAVTADPRIDLYLGTSLAGFGTTARGIVATARQGRIARSFEAEGLVGADGVHSSVRARLVGGIDDRPRETGRTAWRTTLEGAAVPGAFAGTDTGLWLSRKAHLVHYPIAGGRTLNVVAITADRLAVDPERLWSGPGEPAMIATRFADWHPSIRALIGAAETWSTWPLYDRAPLPVWHAGPVALLGDAAHPILPFLAQGAAQAIEDAAALAAAVAGITPLPDAFAAYSARRVARATRVQLAAREQGRIYHLGGAAALARDAAMRLAGSRRLLSRYDWLFGA